MNQEPGIEKRLLLALAMCVLLFVTVTWLFPGPPPKPRPKADPAKTDPAKPGPAKPDPPANGNGPAPAPGPGPAPVAAAAEPAETPPVEFKSGRLTARVRSKGASLDRTWIRGIAAAPRSDPRAEEGALRLLEESPPDLPGALGVSFSSKHFTTLDLERRHWEPVPVPGGKSLLWRSRVLKSEKEGRGIVVEVRHVPCEDPGGFHLRCEVTWWNEDPDLAGQDLVLRVRGPALLHAVEGSRDAMFGRVKLRPSAGPKSVTGPQVFDAAEAKSPVPPVTGDIEWAGTASTYFAALLDPDDPPEGQPTRNWEVRWEALKPLPDPKTREPRPPQPSPVLCLPVGVEKPGTVRTLGFRFYAGPTADFVRLEGVDTPVLSHAEYAAYAPVRDPGMFDLISTTLFFLLKGFHALVPSWGLDIILLTVLVRGLMVPLSVRQMRSTLDYGKKMAKVKPKLDALREKYGEDRQRMAQEQMRLMKEHNVPLMPGGCLLTFLQLPIWWGLYSMLQYNFDLRHAEFLWMRDLSHSDGYLIWHVLPNVRNIPFVPNSFEWFNILPIFMTATWFFASKATMTPPADEQQAQMQRMMQWMPFVMLLFPGFYDMPAGLCLYITASSTWGIVESRIIRKKYA